MARSVFKRLVKMGIKEVRKSIAGLTKGKPHKKVFQYAAVGAKCSNLTPSTV